MCQCQCVINCLLGEHGVRYERRAHFIERSNALRVALLRQVDLDHTEHSVNVRLIKYK